MGLRTACPFNNVRDIRSSGERKEGSGFGATYQVNGMFWDISTSSPPTKGLSLKNILWGHTAMLGPCSESESESRGKLRAVVKSLPVNRATIMALSRSLADP